MSTDNNWQYCQLKYLTTFWLTFCIFMIKTFWKNKRVLQTNIQSYTHTIIHKIIHILLQSIIHEHTLVSRVSFMNIPLCLEYHSWTHSCVSSIIHEHTLVSRVSFMNIPLCLEYHSWTHSCVSSIIHEHTLCLEYQSRLYLLSASRGSFPVSVGILSEKYLWGFAIKSGFWRGWVAVNRDVSRAYDVRRDQNNNIIIA